MPELKEMKFGWAQWKRIPGWLWSAWPFWICASVSLAHIGWQHEAHAWFGFDEADLAFHNKLIAAALQLLGGGLVIHSIDGNLRMFEGKHVFRYMLDRCSNFFRKIPFIVHTHVLEGAAGSFSSTLSDASAILVGKPGTLEQRVQELESEVKKLEAETKAMRIELRNEFYALLQEVRSEISTLSRGISSIEQKMKSAAVDGATLQLVGIWLLLHGTAASLLS